jgi:hypothetical protein
MLAFSGSGASYAFLQLVAPSGGTPSNYGRPLAVDSTGVTAIVGGSADATPTDWIFTRTGPNWFPGASVTASDVNDSWGSVATDAGALVIGGTYLASVYTTSVGGPQILAPSDFMPNSTNGFFGSPLAMSGNTLLVAGEPFDSSGQLGHYGYLFVKSGSNWVEQAKLVPSDLLTNSGSQFRFSVALDGPTAVLATTFGAYVFTRSGSTWIQAQKIDVPDGAPSFGSAVDLSGDTMVISGLSTVGGIGAAYVYGRSGASWIPGPALSSGTNADSFGTSVAVSQGTVAVGAPSSGSDGVVYVFSCQPDR